MCVLGQGFSSAKFTVVFPLLLMSLGLVCGISELGLPGQM